MRRGRVTSIKVGRFGNRRDYMWNSDELVLHRVRLLAVVLGLGSSRGTDGGSLRFGLFRGGMDVLGVVNFRRWLLEVRLLLDGDRRHGEFGFVRTNLGGGGGVKRKSKLHPPHATRLSAVPKTFNLFCTTSHLVRRLGTPVTWSTKFLYISEDRLKHR